MFNLFIIDTIRVLKKKNKKIIISTPSVIITENPKINNIPVDKAINKI